MINNKDTTTSAKKGSYQATKKSKTTKNIDVEMTYDKDIDTETIVQTPSKE